MLDLVSALQEYKSSKMVEVWWHNLINSFVEEQEYSLEDYADFCFEQQDIWGNTNLPRHSFLKDIIVKPVPFTTDEVYYAMSAVPNFRVVSRNNIRYIANVDSCFRYKDEYSPEIAGVCFFRNMEEVRRYYSNGVNVGEIILYRLLEFFSSFNSVTDINVSKFLKNAKSLSLTRSAFILPYSNVMPQPVMYDGDIKMSKILHKCLVRFQTSWRFFRKFMVGCSYDWGGTFVNKYSCCNCDSDTLVAYLDTEQAD